jgi:hypothetical protein
MYGIELFVSICVLFYYCVDGKLQILDKFGKLTSSSSSVQEGKLKKLSNVSVKGASGWLLVHDFSDESCTELVDLFGFLTDVCIPDDKFSLKFSVTNGNVSIF